MESDHTTYLRQLQLTELNILKQVIDLCEQENLRYFMLGGTFLGAIRHEGFIPWDDDIDIGMPRADYDRFFEIAPEKLAKNLIYKNYWKGNEKTIYFSRVEDSRVQIHDDSALKHRVRNAWIDIFPMDGMPNNAMMRRIHEFRLLARRALLQYSQFSVIVNQDLPNRPFHERALIFVGNIINFEKILDTNKCMVKLDRLMRKYSYDDSNYVVNFMGAYKFKEMFPKTVYESIREYPFETEHLIGPENYDLVLSQLYGDYMQLPPEHQRNKHHSRVIYEEEKQ